MFAAARQVKPELRTVSHGYSSIITQYGRGKMPLIDLAKVECLKSSIVDECVSAVGFEDWHSVLLSVDHQVSRYEPLDLISGKDFLIPFLTLFLRGKGCGSMSTESLIFKLAKYCSLERMEDISTALNNVISGKTFMSA